MPIPKWKYPQGIRKRVLFCFFFFLLEFQLVHHRLLILVIYFALQPKISECFQEKWCFNLSSVCSFFVGAALCVQPLDQSTASWTSTLL